MVESQIKTSSFPYSNYNTQRDRSRDETFKGDVPLQPRYNAVMGVAARTAL